jgi:hypothetical protein
MEYCRLKKVSLQAWSPLAQGILMGNLDSQPGNIRETAALVKKYAQRHETTAEAILLAWLLKHPVRRFSRYWELHGRIDCALVPRRFRFPSAERNGIRFLPPPRGAPMP